MRRNLLGLLSKRGSSVVERAAHNRVVAGSSPAPATISTLRACAAAPSTPGPRVARAIVLRGATSAIRLATFQNREHIVVPLVGLVQGVLHAVNAPDPELVLAEEFSKAPDGWNGRPVMLNHPFRNGEYVSANMPTVLEAECFGTLFNTHVDGQRLLTEAWLDPERAEAVGPHAVRVIERARAGDPIEISVGTFMELDLTGGVYDGKRYSAVWRRIVPDHMAMLQEGHTGACSNEMGCGVRAASAHLITARGFDVVNPLPEPTQESSSMKRSLKARFLALITAGATATTDDDKLRARSLEGADDISDVELRGKLHDALRAVEPGFLWIEEVFVADNLVVFATEPERELLYIRRRFALAADGTVTIPDGDREQVSRTARWDAVTVAGATSTLKAAGCGCGGAKPTTATTETGDVMKKTERIAALIASKKNTFTAAHQAFLEAQTDEQLKALQDLEATAAEIADPAAPKTDAAPATGATTTTGAPAVATGKVKTAEEIEAEFLASPSTPESMRTLLAEDKARKVARKTAILAALKGNQDAYTDAELDAMPVAELEKVARVAKVATAQLESEAVDFGALASRTTSASDAPEAAPDLVGAIRTAAGVK